MLAIADVATALVGAAIIVRGTGLTFAVVLLAVPVWIVLAKLHGLYDRDHRSLRHLTTDEAPMLVACTLVAAVATGVIVVPLAAAPVPLTTCCGPGSSRRPSRSHSAASRAGSGGA